MREFIYKVKGISCGGCENRIQTALKNIKGIKTVIASHESGTVTITMEEDTEKQVITDTIENIGFKVVKDD